MSDKKVEVEPEERSRLDIPATPDVVVPFIEIMVRESSPGGLDAGHLPQTLIQRCGRSKRSAQELHDDNGTGFVQDT